MRHLSQALGSLALRSWVLVAPMAVATILPASLPAFAQAPKSTSQKMVGKWLATLEMPDEKIRVGLEVLEKGGAFSGVAHSPDQGEMDMPLASISCKGDILNVVLEPGISFEGKLSADGNSISGKFTQEEESLPLVFKRVDKIPQPTPPPAPAPQAKPAKK